MATVEDTDEGRVVQMTLEESEYEEFQRVADERGLSVEEALRRATLDYVDFHDELGSLLETVDDLDDSVGEPTDASDMDEDLYGATAEDSTR